MEKNKNIVIISFESKKTDLIEWSYFNKNVLAPHHIFASGFAASILEGTLNKKINKLEPANLGGNRYLCNLIRDQKIDALIIFGDSEEIFETKDLKGILETAIQQNIIVVTNRTTADFLLHSSLIRDEYIIHSKEKKQTESILKTSASIPLAKAS